MGDFCRVVVGMGKRMGIGIGKEGMGIGKEGVGKERRGW